MKSWLLSWSCSPNMLMKVLLRNSQGYFLCFNVGQSCQLLLDLVFVENLVDLDFQNQVLCYQVNWLEWSKTSMISQVHDWQPMIFVIDVQIERHFRVKMFKKTTESVSSACYTAYQVSEWRLVVSNELSHALISVNQIQGLQVEVCLKRLLVGEVTPHYQELQWRRQDIECIEGEPVVEGNPPQFGFVRGILDPLKPSFESQEEHIQLEGLIRQRVECFSDDSVHFQMFERSVFNWIRLFPKSISRNFTRGRNFLILPRSLMTSPFLTVWLGW